MEVAAGSRFFDSEIELDGGRVGVVRYDLYDETVVMRLVSVDR